MYEPSIFKIIPILNKLNSFRIFSILKHFNGILFEKEIFPHLFKSVQSVLKTKIKINVFELEF
ncbi:hypothetical protein BpHYR1_004725 [Brachionus plicatilis]|uniref:Uncharacterized protein n=1 Tax=Brachionus plicatilis TaxID=10195 RepID=A0A3M7R3C1_BRAPC|nr:hypothetical protein BpHYR1_004725 [Brachionus plicatilis]